ncbi:MAG: bacillithiol biosynthesis cysteine-adding enzyme BshC, partial [Bryobacteraceae bacterium]
GTSKLLDDYLYHFERVERYFGRSCFNPDSFSQTAGEVRFPEERRAALVGALREQNGDSPALGRLAQRGCLAVVTGQQVGLFSGPAYTIYKALTAAKLAQHLTEQGIDAVPVFWLATEDHDLAEVDHTWVFDHNTTPRRISLKSPAANGGPVGDVKAGELPWDELKKGLGDLPYAGEVLGRIQRAYTPEASLGAAFRELLRGILRDFDLLYVDPLAPAIRAITGPFLAETVHRVPEMAEALRQRNQELVSGGYHAQVHIEENSSLLFLIRDGKRLPLRWKDGRFAAKDRSYNMDELQAMGPSLSPNALLRPVMQDYLLPTIGYVGGPAETAYMAQAQVLYQSLLGRMPVIFPRNGFTLLDVHASKLMERYEVRVPDLLDHRERVHERMAAKLVPPGLHQEFVGVRLAAVNLTTKLETDLRAFDPTLDAAARKGAAKILYQLDKLARKTAREAMRREERAGRDADFLEHLVYPHKHLQERFYSIVPFLAKYGPDLPGLLMDEVQLGCPDHMIRVI